MQLSTRTRLSLWQFLESLGDVDRETLLMKHGVFKQNSHLGLQDDIYQRRQQRESMLNAPSSTIEELMNELVRTKGAIRKAAITKYSHDERWKELLFCALLDGYHIPRDEFGREGDYFVAIEPIIEGQGAPEDDLSQALGKSGLASREEIQRLLAASANAFRDQDFNGCLTNARVALETLAKDIATAQSAQGAGAYERNGWGSALAFLRSSDFISKREEQGFAGVYSFISEGAHAPIGLTEQEFGRFGRNLAVSMSYFLLKRHVGK